MPLGGVTLLAWVGLEPADRAGQHDGTAASAGNQMRHHRLLTDFHTPDRLMSIISSQSCSLV